ncbi:hypothetical protein G9A89_016415 [Geosiphon pyriformis]|nr:hypothetical protein G9A89_016415 [Geosiphon pyriformis]
MPGPTRSTRTNTQILDSHHISTTTLDDPENFTDLNIGQLLSDFDKADEALSELDHRLDQFHEKIDALLEEKEETQLPGVERSLLNNVQNLRMQNEGSIIEESDLSNKQNLFVSNDDNKVIKEGKNVKKIHEEKNE